MVMVVKKENVKSVLDYLQGINEPVYEIGHVVSLSKTGGKQVEIKNIELWKV